MKNYIQEGDTLVVTAPAGGVTSGQLVLAGTTPGVAQNDAAASAEVVLRTEGVFELPKVAGTAIGVGVKVYYDAIAKNITLTSAGNTPVGNAWADAAAADTTVKVSLERF